jgi:hypothetical protein
MSKIVKVVTSLAIFAWEEISLNENEKVLKQKLHSITIPLILTKLKTIEATLMKHNSFQNNHILNI